MAHSLSPVLHRAAYATMGLTGWSYDAIDCPAGDLEAFLAGLGPEWVGLSVTMPHKTAALSLAERSTERARAVGAANTLLRTPRGWWADCTDVDGITGGLAELGLQRAELADTHVAVVGAGGTARAALVAFAGLGVAEVDLCVRSPHRAGQAVECGERAGLRMRVVSVADVTPGAVAVSTVPAAASESVAGALGGFPAVLDVVYDPWPTPVAAAAVAAGAAVVGGRVVLLHQAFGQVELFTGSPAPRTAMARALAAARDPARSGVED